MPTVVFTSHLQRHVAVPRTRVAGETVREALEAVFSLAPQARLHVLDGDGALRRHVVVFIDGEQVEDRRRLSDTVGPDAEVYVMQALSGG